MGRTKSNQLSQILEQFSLKATKATGTSMSFILALSVIIVWTLTGPLFHFCDTWQLVINTSTTIVAFLLVFLIQRTQNKDARIASSNFHRTILRRSGLRAVPVSHFSHLPANCRRTQRDQPAKVN